MALTARMVTIDCADPRGLAKFCLDATGYELRAGSYVGPAPAGHVNPRKVPERGVAAAAADLVGNAFCVSGRQ